MSPDAFQRLKRGIAEFGLVDPIVARREDRLVVGGHQRLRAAIELALVTVPVVFLDGLSDEHAAALNVLLNNPHAQGEWDFSKLSELLSTLDGNGFDATLSGFDDDELQRLLTWTPGPPTDDEWADAFDKAAPADVKDVAQITFVLTRDNLALVRQRLAAIDPKDKNAALVQLCRD